MSPNPANVAALHAILDAWYAPVLARYGGGATGEVIRELIGPEATQLVAEALASQDVLSPSALTDEQAVSTNRDHPWIERDTERAALARFVRERLAQIARGEEKV